MHASVLHGGTHVTSHTCHPVSSCPEMQWCSMKFPHVRCRKSCRIWLYPSNMLDAYFMTVTGSTVACAGVLLHIHVLMLNHQCWRACACVCVRTWTCVSACVCVCVYNWYLSHPPSIPLSKLSCSPQFMFSATLVLMFPTQHASTGA